MGTWHVQPKSTTRHTVALLFPKRARVSAHGVQMNFNVKGVYKHMLYGYHKYPDVMASIAESHIWWLNCRLEPKSLNPCKIKCLKDMVK